MAKYALCIIDPRIFVSETCESLGLLWGSVSYSKTHLYGYQYPVGTMATFRCYQNLVLSGPRTRTCQASGYWSSQLPKCIGNIYKTKNTRFCINVCPSVCLSSLFVF